MPGNGDSVSGAGFPSELKSKAREKLGGNDIYFLTIVMRSAY